MVRIFTKAILLLLELLFEVWLSWFELLLHYLNYIIIVRYGRFEIRIYIKTVIIIIAVRTITTIIVRIINITIQFRLIVRAIINGIVNMGVFTIVRGSMIVIIIFASIRVIFMTKVTITVIIIINHIIRKPVIMTEGCYALCLDNWF